MDPVIRRLREELTQEQDEHNQKSFQRFFKEGIRCYGIKTATVTRIAKKYWKEIQFRDKQEVFSLCEELYQSGYCEEAFIVSDWVPNLKDRFGPEDLAVFRHWIETYISNWAECDGFCNHSVGDFIVKFPESIAELKCWARSGNRWLRRAAAVSLIIPAKRGKYLDDVFEIADLLLTDEDDMVRKGYGWLLKEASRNHQEEVFDYVMQNRNEMPRTSLRYAIELMPEALRAQAMEKKR